MSLFNELFTALKKNHVFKLSFWSYFIICWKEHFFCKFKLIDEFINRLVFARLRGLNEQLIVINDLLSGASILNKYSILSAAQKMLFNWIFDRYLCAGESSENLLKIARAEYAWIITFSFNCNKKFSMNKNMCLNMLKAVEIDEYQLNLLINVIKILISFLISVFKNDKSNCLLCWFVPIHNEMHSIRLSKKMNHHIITVLNFY